MHREIREEAAESTEAISHQGTQRTETSFLLSVSPSLCVKSSLCILFPPDEPGTRNTNREPGTGNLEDQPPR